MTVTITPDQVRTLSDYLAENADVNFQEDDDFGVFRTYSGRGMMGRECLGLVISDSDVFKVAMALGQWMQEADPHYTLKDAFTSPRTDNMGYDTVYYWTQIVIEDDEDGTGE